MAQVVVKNLELDCVPEPTPGTRKDTVHKLVPELGKRGFDGLPPLCRQELLFGCIGSCQHQHLGFFGHFSARCWPRSPRSPKVTPPSTPSSRVKTGARSS